MATYDLRWFHATVDFCLFMIGTFYVILVPYTKVEESFNMQASHDMLFYGYTDTQHYDHHQFGGVVPRTFIGSLVLSLMVQPFKLMMQRIFPLIFSSFNLKMYCQHLIRMSLLSINIMSLSYFRKSFIATHFASKYTKLNKKDMKNTIQLMKRFSILFAILITAQFHYLFYQSRLLPNCFALPFVTVSFGFYFRKKYHLSLQSLAASTIIFRCDTIVIAFPFIIIMLLRAYQESKFIKYQFQRKLIQFISRGVIASIVCIALSLAVDSWFWNQYKSLKWPEFEVLLYNTVDNKSSNWGISPWHEYFTKHLIKMLLVNIIFIPCAMFKIHPILFIKTWIQGCYANKSKNKTSFWKLCVECLDFESMQLALICFIFLVLYSFLPHKETRFIFFVIPPFTLLSTIGCIRLLTLWGFSSVNATKFTLDYYRQHLYKRQAQFSFMCIATEHHNNNKRKIKKKRKQSTVSWMIIIGVIIAICVSIIIVLLGVIEASYNYSGGAAIKKFELITRSNYTKSCYNYNNILSNNMDINQLQVNCVHIGNKAAMTGVMRFTIPVYCNEFRFDKTEHLKKGDYVKQKDPCHWMDEICTNGEHGNDCFTSHESNLKGYGYLITEFEHVPGYELIPNGIIYAKAGGLSIFRYLKQLMLSPDSAHIEFLKPSLYILKQK